MTHYVEKTVCQISGDGLEVAGVILNDSRISEGDMSVDSNREQIASRAMAPVLTRLRFEAEQFDDKVDWAALAGSKKVVT